MIVEASYGGMTLLFNLQMVPIDAATSGRSRRRPPELDDGASLDVEEVRPEQRHVLPLVLFDVSKYVFVNNFIC